MRGLSFPDCFAFSADAFWKAGGISLPCQIIWTGCTCLASLPACLLLSFTQHSLWHPFLLLTWDGLRFARQYTSIEN